MRQGTGAALLLALALSLPAAAQETAPPLPSPAATAGADRPAPRPGGDDPLDSQAAPAPAGSLIPPDAYAEPVEPFRKVLSPLVPKVARESDFDHAACLYGLTLLGVDHVEVAPVVDPDERQCGISRPVEVRAIQPGVVLEGDAVMRCETARALALWTREMVIPAAQRMPGSPRLTSVAMGTSYFCRGVVGDGPKARLSEHALGNALDIAGFGLGNGARLDIAPVADRGGLDTAFQNTVQSGACLYFTTVLGPGSNAAHDDHLHLDIKPREGGLRLCQ